MSLGFLLQHTTYAALLACILPPTQLFLLDDCFCLGLNLETIQDCFFPLSDD